MKQNIKHGVPALFSFFVSGLGQLIKGDWQKAMCIYGFYLLALMPTFLAFLTGPVMVPALSLVAVLGWFSCFFIWLWNVYDAYNN